MGKVTKFKPTKVATPGAYSLEASLKSNSGNRKKKFSRGKKDKNTKKNQTAKRKDRGVKKRDREEDSESNTRDTPKRDTPSKGRRPKRKGTARKDNYRTRYTPEQIAQAVRLVREDGFSVAAAAEETGVPRMTLNDRMKTVKPVEDPKIGRPQEISKAAEKAIVDCLCLCAEFQSQ
jgi:transposase-like protein